MSRHKGVKFVKAKPLKEYNKKKLMEDYDYKNCSDSKLFSSIKMNFKIQKVVRINNPYLFGMYSLYKEELEQVKNAKNIANNNIDWRKTRRQRYGEGAYFASTPSYANKHSNRQGAFLICKVIIKNIERVNANYGLKVPSKNKYDTALGNYDRVYVKFDDYNFYPEYLVYYS